MASITDLYKAIKDDDIKGSPFEGVSYDLTYNDTLGMRKVEQDDEKFTILSPFVAIAESPYDAGSAVKGKMPIEQAFKAVLREGIRLSKGQNTLFIDIADLDQNNSLFFTEGGDDSVSKFIADQVNTNCPATVKPVIRFLRGMSDEKVDANFWTSRQQNFEDIFWQEKDGRKVNLIKNEQAELHVGFYSPSFRLPKNQEQGLKVLLSAALCIAGYKFNDSMAMLGTLFGNVEFSASWNHGKILAVGGRTMMTGGINYWDTYTSSQHDVLDMQAKVTGDAAISAHNYADYFWKYLNNAHVTDSRSFKRSIKLNTPFDKVAASWKTDTVVPIFQKDVKLTPKTSGIRVLSIARLGDWRGNFLPDYPVQFVDALRDLLVNISAPGAVAAGDFKRFVSQIEEWADNRGIMGALRGASYSPAAWASRTIRVKAIENAKTSVYMSNQMIVGALQKRVGSYNDMVNTLNKGKEKNQIWDGYLWPYDLLLALAKLIVNWHKSSDPNAKGIQIVLSGKTTDWGDERTIRDLYDKIIPLIRGINPKFTQDDANGMLNKWMLVKRIGSKLGPIHLHTKTVCVDEQLLYVGSDNLYPSYNEEHGIWVDDKAALADWVEHYWKALWSKLDGPDDEDLRASAS